MFDRYPNWKEKVLQLVSIHREQGRLQQVSREVQSRGMTISTGLVVSRSDIMNERAESLKEKRYHARSTSAQSGLICMTLVRFLDAYALKPLLKLGMVSFTVLLSRVNFILHGYDLWWFVQCTSRS